MTMIQVMVVDDHALMRQGLRAVLQQEATIAVLDDVNSGAALLQAIRQGAQPDVVLMDIQMPGMSGIETTQSLKALRPTVQVIGLTAIEDTLTLDKLLHAGACNYVLKTAVVNELVQVIHAAYTHTPPLTLAGQKRRTPCMHQRHLLPSLPATDEARQNLTKREVDVLKLLTQACSNKEIARRLALSERTIQTHLTHLFVKLAAASRTEAVLIALRDGWLSTSQR